MSHPNAVELEAFALGEPAGEATKDHLASCDACRAYVERVGTLTNASHDAEARVEELAKRGPVRTNLRTLFPVAVTFAVAAAVLVLFTRPAAPGATTERPVLAARDPEPPEPDTTFKGGLTVAVVRERGPEQTRFTRSVAVRSGDRLRLEVALDRTDAILAAVLGDDGSFLELMTEGVRDAGMHLSERSARVDGEPTRGVIVVGKPENVRRARATRDTSGLVTFPIEVESR